ncbi:hypothetical protein QGP82_24990 [Leptothoe sp. LEGE 181152]|nr:hypothetical protein [Leptothoe sp. LEGE 181152]
MGRKLLTIEAINARLETAQLGLKIYQRGEKLSIRGTLPPKPSSKRTKPHQQLISLGCMPTQPVWNMLSQKPFAWEVYWPKSVLAGKQLAQTQTRLQLRILRRAAKCG